MSDTRTQTEGKLLLAEFADEDQQAVSDVVALVLDFYADKASRAPGLRYWYAVRHLIDHLRKTKYPDAVDTAESDERTQLREKILSLENMRDDANEEINKIERQARAGRPPQIGQMTATSTVQPPCPNTPDPNSRAYRGDPLRRSYTPR